MDAENQSSATAERGRVFRSSRFFGALENKCFRCSWFYGAHVTRLRWFLQTTAPGLHSVMDPFNDTAPLEAHGEEFLELLINKAPDAEWMEWLFASLLVAARANNSDVFHRIFALCKNNPELWAGPNRRYELVVHTAEGGSIEILSALLEIDFLVSTLKEVYRRRDSSALIAAATNGYQSCVAALIKAGASLEHKLIWGVTALTAAVANDRGGVVLELLAAGADVDNINDPGYAFVPNMNYPNYTPLGIASATDNGSMVDILLAAGADFDSNQTDILPVIIAAQTGSCRSLKRLLLAGADANVVNARGQSALHIACRYCCDDAVELLLRHNASFTSRCHKGLVPCDVVAMDILHRRERQEFGLFPSTLGVVETAAADRIYGMLRGARAWRRRSWLVMMRARRLVSAQRLDEFPSEKASPTIEHVPTGHDGKTTEGKDGDVCIAVEGLSLADAHPLGTPGVLDGRGKNEDSTNSLLLGRGHGSGNQTGHASGWESVVEWLLQCPDERGVFREILGFL